MSVSEVMKLEEIAHRINKGNFDEKTPLLSSSNGANGVILDAPKWFTQNYMENCLRKHYKDVDIRITRLDVCPALGKGENYGGVLTRATVHFCTSRGAEKVGRYVLKTSYESDEFARKLMEPFDIFNREMTIYENVLPKLKALLAQAGDTEQLFAETLAVDAHRSALLFEDLNVRQYVMPDRIQGFDMKHAKLVLRKLAKMHAASAVLNERESGCLETFNRGMFNRYTDNYAPGFVGLLGACERRVSEWGGEFAHLARKLKNLKPMYMELGKRVFDCIAGHLNVLAHGDLWTNNVMVKYDEFTGEPLDAIIIDFQYSAWGSPAIDLLYMLNTSMNEEIHLRRQDELIQYYYNVLADTLKRLSFKSQVPSLHKFHLQLESKAFYAFSSTCVIQPVQRNEKTDDADFSALMKEDERAINFKNTCYKNLYCQKIIRQLLPLYDQRGLLDLDQ